MLVTLAIRRQGSGGSHFEATWANSFRGPISKKKKPFNKRAGGVAQSVGPEFKPQYCKKLERGLESVQSRAELLDLLPV
jgi:hypothetical protein